jgi:hypothetical protein
MATTLYTYITTVRRLLHDANANFWTDQELTDDINDARNRLVRDTGVLRQIQPLNTVTNQEVYSFSSLPQGAQTMDILNINLYWGNMRVPLAYLAWTDFNAKLRPWQNFYSRPVAFSFYGPQQFYLGPNPDQVYALELDTVIEPLPLVNPGDVDPIPDPWTGPVSFYACYLAKFKEQSYGEAELFQQQYQKRVQSVLTGTYTRRLPDPYSRMY